MSFCFSTCFDGIVGILPVGSSVYTLAKYWFNILAFSLFLSTNMLSLSNGSQCRLAMLPITFVLEFVYFQKALLLVFAFMLISLSFCFKEFSDILYLVSRFTILFESVSLFSFHVTFP